MMVRPDNVISVEVIVAQAAQISKAPPRVRAYIPRISHDFL